MKLTLPSAALYLVSILSQGVSAGAAAKVQACLKWETDIPDGYYEVEFLPGEPAGRCMNEWGKSAKIPIRRKGFNCADLGVVELKASSSGGDTCATDHSIWWLTVKHGGKEGSMRVRWFSTPKVYMEQQPGTSVVCGLDKSEAKCDQFGGREQGWPGNEVGNLIFVFRGDLSDVFVENHENQHLIEQDPLDELK